MILKDLHVHTTYCDGNDTPEEMVNAAIEKGLNCIGFSAHSYTSFEEEYCIKKENIPKYISEINFLKEKYQNKIKILLGIEQDYYSDIPAKGYDYVIGAVHYLKINNKYFAVDETKDKFIKLTDEHFGGDYYALCEKYFETVYNMAKEIKPDFIAHFTLITKFNKDNQLFDEQNKRYLDTKKEALDKILKLNIPFEINTGAMSRGYKAEPYPDIESIRYISNHGGSFIFSGDVHSKDNLCFEFIKWENILKKENISLKLIDRI